VNRGLVYLLRKGAVGRLRMLLRQSRTLKGALTILVLGLFLASIVVPQLLSLGGVGRARPAMDPEWLLLLAPVVIMVLSVLTAASGHALFFRPAEIDFLFPAPISRRELLLYHLGSRAGVQVLSGLFMSIFLLPHAGLLATGLLAAILAAVFMHVLAQLLTMLNAAVDERIGALLGRWRLPIVVALGLAALAVASAYLPRGAAPLDSLRLVAGSPVVQLLAMPARPFVELFVARDGAAAIFWAAIALAVLAAAIAMVLMLDVAITERALASSRKVTARLQRIRQGGGASAAGRFRPRHLRMPSLDFLGAGAPLAVRQLRELVRNPRGALTVLVGTIVWLALVVGLPIYESLRVGEPVSQAAGWAALGAALLAPIFLASQLPHDFRRDIDRMALLKSLPLKPANIVVGQLFTGALVCTSVQVICAGLVVAFTGVVSWAAYLALVLALPALAWTILAVDNATFLLMPYRAAPGTSDNTQFMGRIMLTMMVKLLAVAMLLLLAASVAGIAWLASGRNPTVAAVAMFLALAAGCIPLTWFVGRAFVWFDVASDVPA
jgi:hypothetical protein